MKYIIAYVLLGLIIGLTDHLVKDYIFKIGEDWDSKYSFALAPLQFVFFAAFGILYLPSLICYVSRLASVINRRRNSREILSFIQAMGLKTYDPIIITFVDGNSRYAGFDRINKKRACLMWFSPGTRISGGGWDMTSHLTKIKKIERAEYRPGVIW